MHNALNYMVSLPKVYFSSKFDTVENANQAFSGVFLKFLKLKNICQ